MTVVQKPKIPVLYTTHKRTKGKVDKNSIKYKIAHLRDSPLIVDGSPGKVSHHCACLVVHKNSMSTNKPFSLYERDTQKVPAPEMVQYEGIYIFGGKNHRGEAMGDLYILITGKRPCNWINVQKYINSQSPSPCARYGHCMHY